MTFLKLYGWKSCTTRSRTGRDGSGESFLGMACASPLKRRDSRAFWAMASKLAARSVASLLSPSSATRHTNFVGCLAPLAAKNFTASVPVALVSAAAAVAVGRKAFSALTVGEAGGVVSSASTAEVRFRCGNAAVSTPWAGFATTRRGSWRCEPADAERMVVLLCSALPRAVATVWAAVCCVWWAHECFRRPASPSWMS